MTKKINELQENDNLTIRLLVKNMSKGATNKNVPYASLTLQDNTGVIEAKLWDLKENQESIIQMGKIIDVNCSVLKYNNALQLRINSVGPVTDEVNLDDYVIASKIPMDELKQQVKDAIASIKNEKLHAIVMDMFKEKGKEFFEYPAASKNHHSFLGGLATHICGMLKIGNALCDIYPELNRDLLISGILVHDYGKMIELSGPITTEYTLEGKLIGHISIVHGIIMETSQRLGIEDSEESILLRHMVLSHHGQYEYGSPVLPLIKEAEMLHYIDNIDARMNTLESALEKTEPGTFTQKIFALENRAFYKPKNEE